jgi:glycosyltransferase involved in cell wall biosynthesis
LFVGRLDDRVKRISAIVRAFAAEAGSHPDADLRIVGDGPDRAVLEALATELAPGRVFFSGWISDLEAKARLYGAAECLVLASWREASPAVVSEAFACGTPVVASRVGALSDLVLDGQTGWTFPAGDDEALRERLSRVLSRPDLVAGMRGPVRECAERHVSREAVLAALEKGFSTAERRHG